LVAPRPSAAPSPRALAGASLGRDATALLDALHQGEGWAYYWQIGGGSTWFKAGEAPELPATKDVYFGVNLVASEGSRGERARSNTVSVVGCLYAEFDAKDFAGDKAAALAHIKALPLPPSIIIDSGNGYHCYWLLTQPWHLSSDEERERARGLQRRWVESVGGDDSAKDLARVLRVPGTLNTKYDPPRPVQLIVCDPSTRYTVAELEALAPAPAPVPVAAPAPALRPLAAATPTEGRLTVKEAITRFNAEHPIEGLLSHYGATRTRDGWACNCGVPHEHETQLAVTSQGKAVFYSARCRWAPSHPDCNGRALADSFDLYTQVEHGGDKTAALKAINPWKSAPRTLERKQPQTEADRRREADRKRASRQSAADANRTAARDRAAEDPELANAPTIRRVLHLLFDIAGPRDWTRISKASLAERLALSERTVQRALSWLEGRYIVTERHTTEAGEEWSGGPGTARRTFLREALRRTETPQTVETGETRPAPVVSPVVVIKDSDPESVRGSGEAPAPPPAPVAAEPAPLCEPRAVAYEGGASFDPAAPAPPPRDLRGMSNWAALCELWAERAAPRPETTDDLAVTQIEAEEEPEVRGPPRDPARAAWYFGLVGKARKPTTGAKQRRELLRQAAELEEWYPATEAAALYLRPAPPPPPRLQLALDEAPAPALPSPASLLPLDSDPPVVVASVQASAPPSSPVAGLVERIRLRNARADYATAAD
jgi:hypothetical protein